MRLVPEHHQPAWADSTCLLEVRLEVHLVLNPPTSGPSLDLIERQENGKGSSVVIRCAEYDEGEQVAFAKSARHVVLALRGTEEEPLKMLVPDVPSQTARRLHLYERQTWKEHIHVADINRLHAFRCHDRVEGLNAEPVGLADEIEDSAFGGHVDTLKSPICKQEAETFLLRPLVRLTLRELGDHAWRHDPRPADKDQGRITECSVWTLRAILRYVNERANDDRLRAAALAYVDRLVQRSGGPVLFRDLDAFEFEGRKVPLIHRPKGINTVKGFDAALTILTTFRARPEDQPYEDAEGADGYLRYKWRKTEADQHDNVALRRALEQRKPLIWFFGVASGVYTAIYPIWLAARKGTNGSLSQR